MNKHTSLKHRRALLDFSTDIVIQDDANYYVKAGAALIHNQGGTNVTVNGTLLYPDDALEIGGGVNTRLFISFQGDYDFNNPISEYPCLRAGNRLVVHSLGNCDDDCGEPFIRIVRGTTAEIDALADISVSVSVSDPTDETATLTKGNTTGSVTIPAGALKVMIYPFGFFSSGDDGEAITTIDGENWPNGVPYEVEAILNPNTQEYKRLPAITLNGNGGRVFYQYTS